MRQCLMCVYRYIVADDSFNKRCIFYCVRVRVASPIARKKAYLVNNHKQRKNKITRPNDEEERQQRKCTRRRKNSNQNKQTERTRNTRPMTAIIAVYVFMREKAIGL